METSPQNSLSQSYTKASQNNKKIKVVHIATVDVGGAYRAVERIYNATKDCDNIETKIILRNKENSSSIGIVFSNKSGARFWSKCKNVINGLFFKKGEITADRFGCNIANNTDVIASDIIVLHWINSFLSMESIAKILKLGKPVIIMLHDMWHMTGGCSYSGDCTGYMADCAECKLLQENNCTSSLPKKSLTCKINTYSNQNVTVVAPGNWISECARRGSVFKNHKIVMIPNCLDTDKFIPVNKVEARELLGIKSDKPVVLFTAMTAGKGNERKGFKYLTEALSMFEDNSLELIVIGQVDEESMSAVTQNKNYLGYIGEEERLALAYSAADVTVVPSLQETFCYTACESMSCGTPVAAFMTGGLLDQIEHKNNGYLAQMMDSRDLADGINFCINNPRIGEEARKAALRYKKENVAEKWVDLFKGLLKD